jgi:hypothetical protein
VLAHAEARVDGLVLYNLEWGNDIRFGVKEVRCTVQKKITSAMNTNGGLDKVLDGSSQGGYKFPSQFLYRI